MLRTLHRRKNLRDPYFDKCVLLLRGNDADGVTSLVDHSKYKRTVTIAGNAEVDTAQSVYGGSSLSLDGAGDYASLADSDDWEFGSNDFTVSLWFRTTRTNVNQNVIARQPGTSAYTPLLIYLNFGVPKVFVSFNNSSWPSGGGAGIISGGAVSANIWYHFAFTRSGNDFKAYLDGAQIGSTYTSSSSFTNYANGMFIGRNGSGNSFAGHQDDIRIYKGVAVPVDFLMKESRLN